MKIEKRVILTEKEFEAIKTVYNIFESDEDYSLFDCDEDMVDFITAVANDNNKFKNFTIVEEI